MLRRVFMAVSLLVLVYLGLVMVATIEQLASAADRLHAGLGGPVFGGLLALFVAVLLAPLLLYLRLPRPLLPPADSSGPAHAAFVAELSRQLARNPRLAGTALRTEADLEAALARLSAEATTIVRDSASAVFVATAVMQNGRLDGLIVLATQFRMVWRIAALYYQRPSPRQMLYLYANVGTAALVADSLQDVDFAAIVTPMVSAAVPSAKGAIPGLQGLSNLLVNSVATGAANAFLTLRVGIVAREYCAALARPDRRQVRQRATAAALGLVGQIVRENGSRVVQGFWSAVAGSVGGAVDSTLAGVRSALAPLAEKVSGAAARILPRREPDPGPDGPAGP